MGFAARSWAAQRGMGARADRRQWTSPLLVQAQAHGSPGILKFQRLNARPVHGQACVALAAMPCCCPSTPQVGSWRGVGRALVGPGRLAMIHSTAKAQHSIAQRSASQAQEGGTGTGTGTDTDTGTRRRGLGHRPPSGTRTLLRPLYMSHEPLSRGIS